ncbi:hypothetical protein Scep_022637 [Stephania cephalantha]|uniref:J domain-containing protein n=1 Tax=Stephania cephalantha TaxID=152367 RepID=A0AAP0HXZ8_9MAGN
MGSKVEGPSMPAARRDPYEVLSVPRDCSDQEIKTAYKKLALKYHPDKNVSNPEASELFKEVAFSYSILSDPEKRRQYDIAGFEAIENAGMDMEIDLSNLGTVNTMFAALFSKLGVPIKTTISATVTEEALNGTITIKPLPIGTSVSGKVEKQSAHFFGVTITDEQAQSGIIIRVTSASQSKFKLLYFEQDINGGYGLALQEDSEKTGKVTSAGMYFLNFQVYRLDSTVNALAIAKDPDAAFFKRLEGLQPCEISELKAGTHIFAVYGDNFFKTASYTFEALCATSYEDTTEKLKEVEAQMLSKRNELRQFETEYRKVDDLLKQRDGIHASFTTSATVKNLSQNGGSNKFSGEDFTAQNLEEDINSDGKDKSTKKKWFNINLRTPDKKIMILQLSSEGLPIGSRKSILQGDLFGDLSDLKCRGASDMQICVLKLVICEFHGWYCLVCGNLAVWFLMMTIVHSKWSDYHDHEHGRIIEYDTEDHMPALWILLRLSELGFFIFYFFGWLSMKEIKQKHAMNNTGSSTDLQAIFRRSSSKPIFTRSSNSIFRGKEMINE